MKASARQLIIPRIEEAKRWYFIAIAHPPSNSEELKNTINDFKRSELKRMDLKGMPLCYEHDHSLVMGTITHSAYSETKGQIFTGYIDLSKDRIRYIYENEITTGKAREFSLQHVLSDKTYENGRRSGFRFLTEVSFVKKGNRDNCDLIFGMTDIELKKKEYLKYKFEQLNSDISSRRDYSLGISFFEKNKMSTPGNPQAPLADNTAVPNGVPQQNTNQQQNNDARQQPEGEVIITRDTLAKFKPEEMAEMLLSSSALLTETKMENEKLRQDTKRIEARIDKDIETVARGLIEKFENILGTTNQNASARESETKEFAEIVNRLHGGMDPEKKHDLGKIFTMVASNTASAAMIIDQKRREYDNYRSGGQQQSTTKQVDPDEVTRNAIMRHFGAGNSRWEPYGDRNNQRHSSPSPRIEQNYSPRDRYPQTNDQYNNQQQNRGGYNENAAPYIPQRGDPLFNVASSNPNGYAESLMATGGRSVDPMRLIAERLATGVQQERRQNP